MIAMQRFLTSFTAFFCLILLANHSAASDTQPSRISQMLNLQAETENMSSIATTLADNIISLLKQQGREIDAQTANNIQLEIKQIIAEEFIYNDWLKQTVHAIYGKYVSAEQLVRMLQVRSRQDTEVMKKIEAELMLAKQHRTNAIIPIIEQRLKKHLH